MGSNQNNKKSGKLTMYVAAGAGIVVTAVILIVVLVSGNFRDSMGENQTSAPNIIEADAFDNETGDQDAIVTEAVLQDVFEPDLCIQSMMNKCDILKVRQNELTELITAAVNDPESVDDYRKYLDEYIFVTAIRIEIEKQIIMDIDTEVIDAEVCGDEPDAILKECRNEIVCQLERDRQLIGKGVTEKNISTDLLREDLEEHKDEQLNNSAAETVQSAGFEVYVDKIQYHNSVLPSDEGFICPLPAGVGIITSPFGEREVNGETGNHGATDISCETGTHIYASNGGKVIRAEWHSSYGYYVLIDHGNGVATLYAHCSAYVVTEGQTVEKGQLIGYVGNSGYAFGSHLHFEYRINGVGVDPEMYVSIK